jgi:hypothetical protein
MAFFNAASAYLEKSVGTRIFFGANIMILLNHKHEDNLII